MEVERKTEYIVSAYFGRFTLAAWATAAYWPILLKVILGRYLPHPPLQSLFVSVTAGGKIDLAVSHNII